MSASDSSTSPRTGKPAKPSPDFPLFAHATKRWAKKINGKMYYFGRWDNPEGALREYEAFLVHGKKARRKRSTGKADDKPCKPSPDFPLFPHATKRWAKKIRGQIHYFGPWDDPKGALDKYLRQKEDLHAGRKPRADTQAGVTVKDVANAFLNHKKGRLDNGELSPYTWSKYQSATEETIAQFGKTRLASDLDADDFAGLRQRMAKKWGFHRLTDMIQHVRSLFKHAFECGLLPAPVRFGPGFARPTKKTMRLHKARQGEKLFTAAEIRRLLDAATPTLRAMILLGINAGLGNSDCATLPLTALDLDKGWLDYPRPKTGVPRRAWLWPETVDALRVVLAKRHQPKEEENAALVFVTKYGESWGKITSGGPISKETRKLLRQLGINGHRSFYTLRHTFRTVADAAKDQPAVYWIMGHEVPDVSAIYRESIGDDRLRAVAELVRTWLFPSLRLLTVAD
jgi:integrase